MKIPASLLFAELFAGLVCEIALFFIFIFTYLFMLAVVGRFIKFDIPSPLIFGIFFSLIYVIGLIGFNIGSAGGIYYARKWLNHKTSFLKLSLWSFYGLILSLLLMTAWFLIPIFPVQHSFAETNMTPVFVFIGLFNIVISLFAVHYKDVLHHETN